MNEMGRTGPREAEFDSQEDVLAYGRWRGAVKSAMKGRNGQAFLKELLAALEAMPEQKLIADELQNAKGQVCALGQVMVNRGIDMSDIDPDEYEEIAGVLGINEKIVQEVEWANDQNSGSRRYYMMNSEGKARDSFYRDEHQRWKDMIDWVKAHIKIEAKT